MLLRDGPSEATAIARRADVPPSRIHAVLNDLLDAGLVEVVSEGRPKKYAPIPPSIALQRLLVNRRRELDERYESAAATATRLERRLNRLSQGRDRDELPAQRVITGALNVIEGTAEAFRLAKRSVLIYEDPIRYDFEREQYRIMYDAVRDAVDAGVAVRVLLPEPGVHIFMEEPHRTFAATRFVPVLGRGMSVRIHRGQLAPFAVVDDERVVVDFYGLLDPRTYPMMAILRDVNLAALLTQRFESIWSGANELWDVATTRVFLESALAAFKRSFGARSAPEKDLVD